MYAYLEGILTEKHPTTVILDVGGVGYELLVPLSTSQDLPRTGEKVKLVTHFHVREDLQQIFGFISEDEKSLFKLLLSVSGIGPKVAITILSGLRPLELINAVQDQNSLPFSSISGIGGKTAERILVELKDRIPKGFAERAKSDMTPGGGDDDKLSDALLALISLGYKKANAHNAVKRVLSQNSQVSVEDLIRESLKVI